MEDKLTFPRIVCPPLPLTLTFGFLPKFQEFQGLLMFVALLESGRCRIDIPLFNSLFFSEYRSECEIDNCRERAVRFAHAVASLCWPAFVHPLSLSCSPLSVPVVRSACLQYN